MAIAPGYEANFETMRRASADGNLALMECTDAVTGKPVITICAVEHHDGEFHFKPMAKMFDGNPYEELVPPSVSA